MSRISGVGGINGSINSLAKAIAELKNETFKNSKEVALVSSEIKKLNKHNEAEKTAKATKETNDPYPVVQYEPNEMTYSELMVRKLDII